MNKNIIWIFIIITIVSVGGVLLFYQNFQSNKDKNYLMDKSENKMMDKKDQDGAMKEGYSGQLLAGNPTPYLSFTKADYQKALKEGKVIFLDFYANWCPVCRAEAPEIHAGFDMLDNDQIVGFRVNFNDSETDEDEKALAKEFEIPYQHTKVILQNGKEILQDGNTWDKNKLIEELSKF